MESMTVDEAFKALAVALLAQSELWRTVKAQELFGKSAPAVLARMVKLCNGESEAK